MILKVIVHKTFLKNLIVFLLLFVIYLSLSEPQQKNDDKNISSSTLAKSRGALLNINNISMWADYNGMLERKPQDSSAGVSFPRGTATIVNGGGLVWGGLVNEGRSPVVRVGGQTYKIGTVPGRIISPGIVENPANDDVRVYRIRRDWANADLSQDAADFFNMPIIDVKQQDIENLRAIYKKDWIEWPWQKGAPYYERNNIPGYQPDTSGIIDPTKDEPGLGNADQVIWLVANDLDPAATAALYGSEPIGLEMQVTCWAYNRYPNLKNVIFQRYRIIYRGTATTPPTAIIDPMYLAKWVDPDVGNYSDDLVGCDVNRYLGYAYNSAPDDEEFIRYKLSPPVIGYDLLQGPRVPSPGSRAKWDLREVPGFENLPMTAFTYFNSTTRKSDFARNSSTATLEWWNLLRGYSHTPLNPPTCFINPISRLCTNYELTGDPQLFNGWVDGVYDEPADRRFALISGPFRMAIGDTQEVVIGLVAGIGKNNRDGISVVKNNDDVAQDAYNLNFDFPAPIPNPHVRTVELDNKIILDWESDTASIRRVESYNSRGYTFETYIIRQYPLLGAPIERSIIYEYFDPSKPRFLYITTDKLRNGPLVNGQRYYFSVTTTVYNPDPSIAGQRLTAIDTLIEVVPHSPNPGTIYPYTIGGTVTDIKNIRGINDAEVNITIFDPAKPDGHKYKVVFHRLRDPIQDFETKPTWSLVDSTMNDTLISHLIVDSPPQRVISRGFSIETLLPSHFLKGVYQTQYNYQLMRDDVFNKPNPGGNYMVVGPGSSTLDSIKGQDYTDFDVELRFVGDSSWTLLRSSLGALDSRWVRVPFTAWERRVIGMDTVYRQLYTIFMKESADTLWKPADLLHQTYNNKPLKVFPALVIIIGYTKIDTTIWYDHYYDDLPYRADMARYRSYLWLNGQYSSPKVSITRAYIADLDDDGVAAPLGTIIRFERVKEIRNADEKIFTLDSVSNYDYKAAQREIERINVFPNPYYGMNRAEINRFKKFVTFSHLPRVATVRIFNLAGILVRTIQKDSERQFEEWDLNNENGLPVAGGLYLAHIQLKDAKGVDLGEKVLKLMIVPENQTPENN